MARRSRPPKRSALPASFLDPIADRHRSCTRKDGYPSEEHARAHAAMNGMSEALLSYRCTYCQLWHLARRKTGD